ncbi:DUF4245 domain-containing protein [Tsukamurella soli]|uniref:DUF4245 domain-containing protein n=1 Tax=Tsukamurella soli TaxID=644556 RepID=UPI00360B8C29
MGSAADKGVIPTVEADAILKATVPQVQFPLREPGGAGVTAGVPTGWTANSSSQQTLSSGQQIVNLGYVTPDRQFLQLSQSDGPAADIVSSVFGSSVEQAGTVPVGDRTWQVYGPASDGRNAWLLPLDGVTLALYGSATVPSFQQLAAAVQDQHPMAKTG